MSEGSLDLIQALLIVGTMWATGVGLGMSVRFTDIATSLRRPALVARTAVLDIVLVPVVMWVTASLLLPEGGIATGLLLVAFASAGPLGIKLADIAGGDTEYAIGIVVVLELANVAAIPIWSSFLGVATAAVVAIEMVRTLVLLVVLPLGVGMLIGRRWATGARRWAPILQRLSSVGVVAVVAFLIVRNVRYLDDDLAYNALLAAALVIGFALAAGWLMGGPERQTRISTSLVTGVRANAAAVAIAATTFAGMPVVSLGVILAGLVSAVLPSLFAAALTIRSRRMAS